MDLNWTGQHLVTNIFFYPWLHSFQKSSLLSDSLHESPFYAGKTRYGGAAANRKLRLKISNPYSVNSFNFFFPLSPPPSSVTFFMLVLTFLLKLTTTLHYWKLFPNVYLSISWNGYCFNYEFIPITWNICIIVVIKRKSVFFPCLFVVF